MKGFFFDVSFLLRFVGYAICCFGVGYGSSGAKSWSSVAVAGLWSWLRFSKVPWYLGVAFELAVFEKDRLYLGGVRRPLNHV